MSLPGIGIVFAGVDRRDDTIDGCAAGCSQISRFQEKLKRDLLIIRRCVLCERPILIIINQYI
ncbi:hypothetical protein AN191_04130 [Loktanella sp. 5RATIMAR09]|nr:hypothetical protein AN191_04130 [Loktanella sp. 5RATIMAR09]